MAELKELAVKIKADTQGLKDIAAESESVGKRMDKALSRAVFHAKEFGIGLKEGLTGVEQPARRAVSTFEFFDKKIVSTNAAMLGLTVAATGVITATTALGAAILSAAKAAADYGEQIDLVRSRTGLSAENISFMAAVARENQATLEDVATAARHLNTELVEFARGQKEATRTFAELGLGAEDFTRAGNDINQILPLVIERLAGMENQSQKVALAVALFGRNGDKLLPTFEAIAKDGEQLKKTFKDLGLVIDDETASAAARFNQSLERLQGAVQGIKLTVGNEFIPILAGLLEKLAEWVASNREIIGQNMKSLVDGLVLTVKNLNTAFGGLKIGMGGIPGEFNAVTVAVVTLNESLILLQKVFVTLKGVSGIGLIARGHIAAGKEILESTREAARGIREQERELARWIATQRGTIAGLAETEGAVSSMGESVDRARAILDRLNNTGALTPPIIKGTGDESKKTAPKVNQLAQEISRLVLEIQKIGKSPEEIVKLEAEARRAIEPSKALVDLWESLSLIQIKLGKETDFLKFLDESIKRTEEQTAALGASNAELRQMTIDALRARLALDVFTEEGLKEAEAKLRAFEQALIDLDLKRTALEAGDAFKTLEEEFGLLPEKAADLKNEFDSLGPFIGQVASEIASTFSDMFEKLEFDWKSLLNNLKRAFFDFVGALIANPIRLALDATLGGGKGAQGAAQQGAGLLSGVTGLGGTLGLGSSGLFGGGAAAGAGLLAGSGAMAGATTAIPSFMMGTAGGTALATSGGTGILATIGAAIPYVGAALAAAAIIIPLLSGLFKKTPRLDIDFDSVKTDLGRRAALVNEFLDPDFFMDNIGQVSVKRKAGLGLGGDEKILELIQERIQETVEGIQDIIRRLPAEIFNQLNETLLNAEIDIDTVIGGERLLEFDAKGKKIAEKFQAFIEGELPAKFFAAIRDSFFAPAFQALGVSGEATQQLIDDFMAKMEAAGSREERAAIGQDFLNTFSAFVDAFNIVSGNANDAIGQTMNTIKGLANSLGFEAVPSIEELRARLGELIENAEIDPETVQAYADLRNAIVSLTSEVVNSISGLIGKMQSLNQTMADLGMATVDMSGYLSRAASDIQTFLQNQGGELSLGEQEAFLDQLTGIANAMLQEEMAAFNAEQERLRAEAQAAYEAQRAAIEAQRSAIQGRIDGLNAEKERINEAFRARMDALNEELKMAQDFAAAAESIRNTLDGIIFSQQSIFTAVERVNMLQGNISELQNQLANTDDKARQLDLIKSLESAFKTLFDTAGEAFGVNSPEFVSIFDQVTGGLSDLANLTENSGRSVEEIQAEIERLTAQNEAHLASIDARIESAQAQLASLQQQLSSLQQETVDNTFVASQELQDLFAYIQSEYQRLLDERFAQLGEINEWGFQTETEGLGVIAGFVEDNLVTLREQLMESKTQSALLERLTKAVEGTPGFAGGSGGIQNFGDRSLAFLHGQEAVLTKAQYLSIMGSMEAAISLQKNFGNVLQSFAGAMSGMGTLTKYANEIQGGAKVRSLAEKITRPGYVSNLVGGLPRTPEQVVRNRTSELARENSGSGRFDVYIHSDNPAIAQIAAEKMAEKVASEVEKRMVKKLDGTAANIRGAVSNVARRARG